MSELDCKFGGEMSGHIFFADDYFGYDDALYVAARLLELLSKTDKKLSELRSVIPVYYSTPEMRMEAKNLLGIYSSLKDLSLESTVKQFSGKNFSDFKKDLSQVLVDKIDPISKEIKKLLKESDFLDKILIEGSHKANEIASKKLKKIHEIVGF